jgi:hypothetical protein
MEVPMTRWLAGSVTPRLAAALWLAAFAALTACDGGGVTLPEDDDARLADAVALTAADAALEDLAVMNDMLVSGPAAGPASAASRLGPGGTMGGRASLIRERTVTFFDAGDVEQESYDPVFTDAVHMTMIMEGEVERSGFSATLSRTRDLWVTGLVGAETVRTFNGTGTESHSRTRVLDEQGTRTFSMEAQATISDVVRAVDRETQPWPLSGTITREWDIVIGSTASGDVVRHRVVTITFDGTQFALMTVDGETFEVDLAAGPDARPHRHRG